MNKPKPSHHKCYRCGVLTQMREPFTFIVKGICAKCSRIGMAKPL